ncbi:hypothetical protein BKA57DRAFT_433726 [Linnemannia elongata]|nr:hypothetical protein BKA57DRAFT_433726 [Linnemannia elongata]
MVVVVVVGLCLFFASPNSISSYSLFYSTFQLYCRTLFVYGVAVVVVIVVVVIVVVVIVVVVIVVVVIVVVVIVVVVIVVVVVIPCLVCLLAFGCLFMCPSSSCMDLP